MTKQFKDFPTIYATLFMFLLTLLSGYGDRLLPPQILILLETSRIAQLAASFLIVLLSLTSSELIFTNNTSIWSSLVYALCVFTGYIIISKQNNITFLLTLMFLFINYMLYKQQLVWEAEDKVNPTDNTKNKLKKLKIAQVVFIIATVLLIVCGVGYYFMINYKDHKDKSSNLFQFIGKFFLEGGNTFYSKKTRLFSNIGDVESTPTPKNNSPWFTGEVIPKENKPMPKENKPWFTGKPMPKENKPWFTGKPMPMK
jgi:hypothetical protein